jgi:hypothetical protein
MLEDKLSIQMNVGIDRKTIKRTIAVRWQMKSARN